MSVYDLIPMTKSDIEDLAEKENVSALQYIRWFYPSQYNQWKAAQDAPTKTPTSVDIPFLTEEGQAELIAEQSASPFYETNLQEMGRLKKIADAKKASADNADKRLANMEKSSGESIYAFMKDKPISFMETIPAKEAVIQKNADGSETVLEEAVPASQVERTAVGESQIKALAEKQGLSALQIIQKAAPNVVKDFSNSVIKNQLQGKAAAKQFVQGKSTGVQMQTSAATPRNVSNFNNANQWSNFYSNQENQMAPPERQPNTFWFNQANQNNPNMMNMMNMMNNPYAADAYWFNLANPNAGGSSEVPLNQGNWIPNPNIMDGSNITAAEDERRETYQDFGAFGPEVTPEQAKNAALQGLGIRNADLWELGLKPGTTYRRHMQRLYGPSDAERLAFGRNLNTGYYPTYGGFLLGRGAQGTQGTGGIGETEQEGFQRYLQQNQRRAMPLGAVRSQFGGLAQELASPTGTGAYGIYGGFLPGEDDFRERIVGAAEAALGTGGSAVNRLGKIYGNLQELYNPVEAANRFASFVGSAWR